MKVLDNVCQRIARDLKQLEKEIAVLKVDLQSFEKLIAYWPIAQLELRLLKILLKLRIKVLELLIAHNNQGSICIMTVNWMIGVVWFEQEPTVNNASELWTKPKTTLPAEQYITFIKHLLKEVQDGNWEHAVMWLNTKAFCLSTGERL